MAPRVRFLCRGGDWQSLVGWPASAIYMCITYLLRALLGTGI